MKRFILVSMIALAAAGITGCGNDDDGTKLRWTNNSLTSLSEINWGAGTGLPDQTWGSYTSGTVENYKVGDTSEFKGIEVLLGQGDALDSGGAAYTLELAAGPGVIAVGMDANPANAQIKEDADATLIITHAKKK